MEQSDGGAARDIVIVTVQYRNFADTAAFVGCLAGIEGSSGCELFVVDNDETGAGAAELETVSGIAPCPVRLVRPSSNLYYWGGAAFALEALVRSGARAPRWVIICNNDVSIKDPSFFHRLRSLDASRYPIVAPTIVSEATGRDQNPFLVTPAGPMKRLKWRLYDVNYRLATAMLAVHRVTKPIREPFARLRHRSKARTEPRRIYAPHGSFVILSETFFGCGGVLDTTVPMFAEELTIAALAENLELPVWYLPDLKVFHREHSTTGARLTRPKYELERTARRHYYGLTV